MWSAMRSHLGDAGKIAVAFALLLPSAGADARSPSGEGFRAELDSLARQIASLDEEHNVAKLRLAGVEREIRDNEKSKKMADKRLAKLRGAASARAAAMYRTGFPGMLLILFGSSNQAEFSRKVGAASKVGDWEAGLMTKLQIANEESEEKAADLKQSRAKARSIRDGLAAKRPVLEARQAEQQRLLDRFAAAAEAARAAAARAAAAARRPRPADTASRASGSLVRPAAPDIQSKPLPVPLNLRASGGAKTALETAYAQTGKPYQWGASGPGSFDCSGLTMYAWRSAGVSLPHSSRAQYASTKRVERSDLQPGDLVFFGSPIHHVGIYVGDGKMINSPETGERVGVRSMNRRDYVGAGRPGV